MKRNIFIDITSVLLSPVILAIVLLEPFFSELFKSSQGYNFRNVLKQIGNNLREFKRMYFNICTFIFEEVCSVYHKRGK
jgi:hypothetical protein